LSTEAPRERGPTHGRILEPLDYTPVAWLPGPHLPTVWASTCRHAPAPPLETERLELPDGDFVDLAWTPRPADRVVIVLHGLEGNLQSRYVRALMTALDGTGYRGVLLQFRGCSGEPNRLDRSYHSGDTGDLAYLVDWLERRFGVAPFAAVGYSLGGNVLLKWLGERGAGAPLATAVAVSVPFDLAACADRLEEGFSRVYLRRLLASMQNKYRRKFATRPSPLAIDDIRRLDTFWKFDDAVTAPLHGFCDAHDYYARSSSRQYLPHIAIPCLIIQAIDDPFVPVRALPQVTELAPATTLELAAHGGHVGFVARACSPSAPSWLESRILRHLQACRPAAHSEDVESAGGRHSAGQPEDRQK